MIMIDLPQTLSPNDASTLVDCLWDRLPDAILQAALFRSANIASGGDALEAQKPLWGRDP